MVRFSPLIVGTNANRNLNKWKNGFVFVPPTFLAHFFYFRNTKGIHCIDVWCVCLSCIFKWNRQYHHRHHHMDIECSCGAQAMFYSRFVCNFNVSKRKSFFLLLSANIAAFVCSHCHRLLFFPFLPRLKL